MLLPSQKVLYDQHYALTELFSESERLNKIEYKTDAQTNFLIELESKITVALFQYGYDVYIDCEKQIRKLSKEKKPKMN